MIVGMNKQMVEGWNTLSKKLYFRVASQLERCPMIWNGTQIRTFFGKTSSHLKSGGKSVAFREIISLQVY